jgi:hypothetical protein
MNTSSSMSFIRWFRYERNYSVLLNQQRDVG